MDIREKRKKVICDLVNDELYVPMKEKELAIFLQVAVVRSRLVRRFAERLQVLMRYALLSHS